MSFFKFLEFPKSFISSILVFFLCLVLFESREALVFTQLVELFVDEPVEASLSWTPSWFVVVLVVCFQCAYTMPSDSGTLPLPYPSPGSVNLLRCTYTGPFPTSMLFDFLTYWVLPVWLSVQLIALAMWYPQDSILQLFCLPTLAFFPPFLPVLRALAGKGHECPIEGWVVDHRWCLVFWAATSPSIYCSISLQSFSDWDWAQRLWTQT